MLKTIKILSSMLFELEGIVYKTVKTEKLNSITNISIITTIEIDNEELSRSLLRIDKLLNSYDNTFFSTEKINLNYLLNATLESIKDFGYISKYNAKKASCNYTADRNLKDYLSIFFGSSYDVEDQKKYIDYKLETEFRSYLNNLQNTDFNDKIKKAIKALETCAFKDSYKANINFFLCAFVGFLKSKKLLKNKNWYTLILK